MNRIVSTGLVVASVLIAPLAMTGCKQESAGEQQQAKKQYTCAHHPEVVQDTPGICPKCNMALTEKK
jgi:hypothetical protein